MEKMYYIQDSRMYLGNAIYWWGKDHSGYTEDLNEAGKYTEEEAKKICRRETDKAWPCEYIDNLVQSTKIIVDAQYTDKKMIKKFKYE